MVTPDFKDVATSDNPNVQSLYQTAKALTQEPDGSAWVIRAIAAALRGVRKKAFIAAHQVKESQIFARIPSVLAGKRPESIEMREWGFENTTLWVKEGKPYLLTSEPSQVSKDQLRALIAHCDEYGVDFQIDAESMDYPGKSLRILFKQGVVTPDIAKAHEEI